MLKPIQLFISVSILLIFVLNTNSSIQRLNQTSDCEASDYTTLYWNSSEIFVGLVKEISAGRGLKTEFIIEKSFRGIDEKSVVIYTLRLSKESFFKQGEHYLIYAYRGPNGLYYIRDCSSAVLLKNAKEHLAYIEDIAVGKTGTRIYGVINQYEQEKYFSTRITVPLAKIKVTIQNKDNKFSTETDENGKYIFKNIPAGFYDVKAEIPNGLRIRVFPLSPDYDRRARNIKANQVYVGEDFVSSRTPKSFYRYSDNLNLSVSSLALLESKIIDHKGEIPPQQFVWLLPVDENGKANLNSPTSFVWTDASTGKLIFDNVPKGKYVMAINRYNCNQKRNPQYRKNFFPGVEDETKAKIIIVNDNQHLKLEDFQLSPPLKERWFSGIVLSTDKKPITDATVFMISKTNQKNYNECFSNYVEIKTDKNGRFELKGYENYNYKIRAYTETENKEQQKSRVFSDIFEIPLEGKVNNIKLIVNSIY